MRFFGKCFTITVMITQYDSPETYFYPRGNTLLLPEYCTALYPLYPKYFSLIVLSGGFCVIWHFFIQTWFSDVRQVGSMNIYVVLSCQTLTRSFDLKYRHKREYNSRSICLELLMGWPTVGWKQWSCLIGSSCKTKLIVKARFTADILRVRVTWDVSVYGGNPILLLSCQCMNWG